MAVCIVVGSTLGYTLGTAIGDAITGFSTPGMLQNRTAIVISLIAAVAATWYFIGTEKLNLAQAAAETARREATESQLMLLQSQLEPHMLFNTLANLRVLITLDPPRAQAMLDRLIGYLRATLGASRIGLHPLADEFDRLADYLALMALRMGPRLQVQLDLPDDLRGLPVPPLLLQPLVENCIRHGLEPKVEGGRIAVRAARRGDQLLLTVRDTGVGLEPSVTNPLPDRGPGAPAHSHYGTQHVATRLATLYGARARFRLLPADDAEGGTLAEVSLPWPESTGPTGARPAAQAASPTPAT
jgi:sensor histidine kinase YesM